MDTLRGVSTTDREHNKVRHERGNSESSRKGWMTTKKRCRWRMRCRAINDQSARWTREERVKSERALKSPTAGKTGGWGKNARTRQKRAKNDAERLERERQGRRKRLPGSLALLPKPVSVCYGLKESRRERVVSIYCYIFVTRQRSEIYYT